MGKQVRYIIKEAKEPGCCCRSIAKLYMTLCDPVGCSMPGFPVLHYLPEFYSNSWSLSLTIQSSHPMSSPSLPAFYFSQPHANELDLCIRWPNYWSFSFSISPSNGSWELIALGLTGLISCCPRDSQESFPIPVWRYQFISTQSFLLFSSHICTWLLEKS